MPVLTPELEKSIRFLQLSRNPVASQLLAQLLAEDPSPVRARSVSALVVRGDDISCQAIAQNFDRLTEDERKTASTRSKQVGKIIPRLLQEGQTESRRAAVAAVCRLGLIESLPQLITIAEERDDTLSAYVQDELYDWAQRAGSRSTQSSTSFVQRSPLVQALFESCQRFDQHHSKIMVESLLSCLRWDDSVAAELFRDPSDVAAKAALQQMRLSTNENVMRLLVESLSLRQIPSVVSDVLYDRQDSAFAECLGSFGNSQINANTRSNVSELRSIPALARVLPTDESHSLEARRGAWLLRAAGNVSTRDLLKGAMEFLQVGDAVAEQTAIDLLMAVPPMSLESGMQSLCAQKTSKSENSTKYLLELLTIFPNQTPKVQAAIRTIFSPFTLEGLKKSLDRWDSIKLMSIANVVRVICPGWQQAIADDLQSPAPIRREKALHMLLYMGVDDERTWECVINTIYDPHEACRVRAAEVLATSQRAESRSLLEVLQGDASTNVREAAGAGLESLSLT